MRHLIVFALLLSTSFSALSAEEMVFFETDLEKAFLKAKSEGKIVLVDFVADWCLPCKVMDQTTFRDPSLKAFLSESVVPVKIDIKYVEGMFLKDKYEVQALPTLIIFDDQRKVLNKIESTVSALELMTALKLHTPDDTQSNNPSSKKVSLATATKTYTKEKIHPSPAINVAKTDKDKSYSEGTDYCAIIGGKYSSLSFTSQYLQELKSVVRMPLRILKLHENGYIVYAINVGSTGTKADAKKTVDKLYRQRIKATILQL